ncbi:myogenic factor 6 isoform X2 [Danio rerio]|uniref:Myogenic factor 6 isoform X2 n=4 Tax=Danio rerio TaxID=7955 RepID=A0AC58J638_DANRE
MYWFEWLELMQIRMCFWSALISTAPARPLLQQQEMLPAMGSRPTHFDICVKCSPPDRHTRFPVRARCGLIVWEGNGGQTELRQRGRIGGAVLESSESSSLRRLSSIVDSISTEEPKARCPSQISEK